MLVCFTVDVASSKSEDNPGSVIIFQQLVFRSIRQVSLGDDGVWQTCCCYCQRSQNSRVLMKQPASPAARSLDWGLVTHESWAEQAPRSLWNVVMGPRDNATGRNVQYNISSSVCYLSGIESNLSDLVSRWPDRASQWPDHASQWSGSSIQIKGWKCRHE